MRGNFVWHELMTTDTQGAGAFYPKVTGWKTQPWEHDASYTLWMGKEAPMGGLMSLPDDAKQMGAPPTWLVYIGTPDIAGTVSHAQRLGGRVLKDVQEAPSVGKWAVLSDPQGATFAVMQGTNPPQSMGKPGTGDFSWHELTATDHRAAFDFYSQLFGWKKSAAIDMGGMGTYQMFAVGGRDIGGMFDRPSDLPPNWPRWLPYVNVPDADAAARAAQAAGGKVMNTMDVPGGDRIAQIVDPQGVAFAVHAYARAAARPATQPKPAPAKAPSPARPPAQPTAAAQPKPASQPASQPKPAPQTRPVEAASPRPASSGGTKSARPAAKKARKTAKRRSPARGRKASGARRAAARKRGARKTAARSAARKSSARRTGRKSAARKSARRASPRRRASARRTTRRPRRAK